MKKIINKISVLLLLAFAIACVDESKDPVKFNEIKKATILALRGDALDAINETDPACSNSFFRNNITGDEAFSYQADYLSEDQESLQEVQLYAEMPTVPRVLVATIPGTTFTFPAGSKTKRGTVSASLATILSKLGLTNATAANLKRADITMTTDLVLKDGSKVLSSSTVNPNLQQSVIFFPAMILTYCANDQADFVPVAKTSLLGTWGKTTDGKSVSRTKIPSLKSGAKDTLYITFDNPIITPPTVTFSPASAGTATALVKAKKVNTNGFYTADDSNNAFYLVYTAGGTYTGAVTAKLSGATADVGGVILTMDDTNQAINVDNTKPVVTSTSTGTRIGKGQFVIITANFNEPMSALKADSMRVNISGQGLAPLVNGVMAVAANGLSASYTYVFKLADPTVPATHGGLTLTFTGGKDLAGNTLAAQPTGNLTMDVNAPPAPTITTAAGYDFGSSIRWSITQGVDPTPGTGNPGGSVSGNVYFIAINSGDLKPTGFSVDLDGIATWIMQVDATPPVGAAANAKVVIRESGIVPIIAVSGSAGQSGTASNATVFTPFAANGTTTDPNLDVYAVFVSSTGTISKISSAGAVASPGAGNPLTVTMN